MSRSWIACAAVTAVTLAIGVSAQTTQQPQPRPATPGATQTGATPRVTVEGCLVREADVPGRKPNVVERQGVMEDYILTSTKIVQGSAPSGSAAKPTGTAGTAGGSATGRMYQVKGIDDEKLKPLLGKRVEIEGTLADLDEPAKPSPGAEDLADLQGTTIRQVTGDCPASK